MRANRGRYSTKTEGVRFVKVPSLDLYREPDPFRYPEAVSEFRSLVDLLELADHDDRRVPRTPDLQLEG